MQEDKEIRKEVIEHLANTHIQNSVAIAKERGITTTPRSLVKSATLKAFNQRVMRFTDNLFNAQASLATGVQHLYRVDKYEVKKANGQYEYKSKPAVLVTDPVEIAQYIDNINNGEKYDEDGETEYYYITTQKPDNQAIDSMLNRTFGKAKESIDVDIDVKMSLTELAKKREALIRDVEAQKIGASPEIIDGLVKDIIGNREEEPPQNSVSDDTQTYVSNNEEIHDIEPERQSYDEYINNINQQ